MYFEDLTLKEQARVERALVKFITSGTIKEHYTESFFKFIQCAESHYWIGLSTDRILQWGAPVCCLNVIPANKVLRFYNQFPRRVELLLAITHRKFFEAYKSWKERTSAQWKEHTNTHAKTL